MCRLASAATLFVICIHRFKHRNQFAASEFSENVMRKMPLQLERSERLFVLLALASHLRCIDGVNLLCAV